MGTFNNHVKHGDLTSGAAAAVEKVGEGVEGGNG